MTRFIRWAAPAAVLVAGGFIPAAFAPPAPAAALSHSPSAGPIAHASGQQVWAGRYNGPGNGPDGASAMAASPDGKTVFVTGSSQGKTSGNDYATVAYSAATGAQLWVKRYNGPGNGADGAVAVAVSPDGSKVFVTGSSKGRTSGSDYATVAYQAATGKWLWGARYNGPANRGDEAASLAVTPAAVFVTGMSAGTGGATDYATVAYRAGTGAMLWAGRYHGSGTGSDYARSVAVNGSGTAVFVTGTSNGKSTSTDFATLAYQAATGQRLWVERYNSPGNGTDEAGSLAVSPSGTAVFVTGLGHAASGSGSALTTVAYRASSGAQLWVNRYNGVNRPSAIAVNPRGTSVLVTGTQTTGPSQFQYVTVAYQSATGTRSWVDLYQPENVGGMASSLAVSPSGTQVYVTGFVTREQGGDYATIAYDTALGARVWTANYNGPGNIGDAASAVAATPALVFVTGTSDIGAHSDYATIAYRP